jgi:hypothetical protein
MKAQIPFLMYLKSNQTLNYYLTVVTELSALIRLIPYTLKLIINVFEDSCRRFIVRGLKISQVGYDVIYGQTQWIFSLLTGAGTRSKLEAIITKRLRESRNLIPRIAGRNAASA